MDTTGVSINDYVGNWTQTKTVKVPEASFSCRRISDTRLECYGTSTDSYTIAGRTITYDRIPQIKGNFDGDRTITWYMGVDPLTTWTKLGTLYIIHHKNSQKQFFIIEKSKNRNHI